MKTRSETLMDFYKKIDEEIYVLKNGFEITNTKLIEKIENLWQSKNLDLLIEQVEELKNNSVSSFVVVGPDLEGDFDLEIAILRIHVLAVLVQELLTYLETEKSDEVYVTLERRYGHYELDLLTLTSLFKAGQQYLTKFYDFMLAGNDFQEVVDFFNYIKTPVENLVQEKDFFNFFENLADLFESIMNFLERIGEMEFEWNQEEQLNADETIYKISLLQWSIYFLLLLKQDATRAMELRTRYKFQKNTDVIDERDDYLNEIEIWKNINKY